MELIFGQNGIEMIHKDGNWDLRAGIGFSPVETFVASVGSCGMYVFEAILKQSNVAHTFKNTKLSYKVNEATRPHPITEITIDYYMEVTPDLQERVQRVMALVPQHCPVMQSISKDIVVIENVHFV